MHDFDLAYVFLSYFDKTIVGVKALTPDRTQMQLVTAQAMKAGFSGGLVIDFPNSSKAKKSVYISGNLLFNAAPRSHIKL